MLVWEMYNDKKNWVTGTRDFAIGLIPDLDYGDKRIRKLPARHRKRLTPAWWDV